MSFAVDIILLIYFLMIMVMVIGLCHNQEVMKKVMQPLESDEEEVKKGKGIKILTPNKLLTRLSVLLAQIKAYNNS